MGRIKKRSNTLSRIFMEYVLVMLGALVILASGTVFAFHILVNTGCVYPANYAERKIDESYDLILNADEVTEDMIPPLCQYIIFSLDGQKLGGNMTKESAEIAWDVATHQGATGDYFYKVIERKTEYVVLQYRLIPQYRSVFLREHFIGPQNLLTTIFLLGGIAIIILPSVRFGKRIKKCMQPMMQAVEKIKNQELEYEVAYSGIKEFDDCILSIDEMRFTLKDALERQWKTEQDKNRQMSALAHDIKTPLTVVRGNAELLCETELSGEQRQNTLHIINSALQIQDYVQKLIDVTKSAAGITSAPEKIETKVLFDDIKKQTGGLLKIYHIAMNWEEKRDSQTLTIVYDQVVRAVMNIIQNAAEHTPEGGCIRIHVEEEKESLRFTVEDSGNGFTKEALLHGADQFFMDDTSRSGEAHYGIGLFFAKTAAENHGGELVLENSEETGGAKVEISFRSFR